MLGLVFRLFSGWLARRQPEQRPRRDYDIGTLVAYSGIPQVQDIIARAREDDDVEWLQRLEVAQANLTRENASRRRKASRPVLEGSPTNHGWKVDAAAQDQAIQLGLEDASSSSVFDPQQPRTTPLPLDGHLMKEMFYEYHERNPQLRNLPSSRRTTDEVIWTIDGCNWRLTLSSSQANALMESFEYETPLSDLTNRSQYDPSSSPPKLAITSASPFSSVSRKRRYPSAVDILEEIQLSSSPSTTSFQSHVPSYRPTTPTPPPPPSAFLSSSFFQSDVGSADDTVRRKSLPSSSRKPIFSVVGYSEDMSRSSSRTSMMRSTSSSRRGLPRVASKLSIASSYVDQERDTDMDYLHTSTSASEREDGVTEGRRTGTTTVNSSVVPSRTSSPVRQSRSRSNSKTVVIAELPLVKSRSGSLTGGAVRPSAIPVRPKTPSIRPPSSLAGGHAQSSRRHTTAAEEVALPPSRVPSAPSLRSLHSTNSTPASSAYTLAARPSLHAHHHSHPSSTTSGLGPVRRPITRTVSGHRHTQSYGGTTAGTPTRVTSRLGHSTTVVLRSPSPGSSASTEASSTTSGADSAGPLTPDTPTSPYSYGGRSSEEMNVVIMRDGHEYTVDGNGRTMRSMRSSTNLRYSAIPPSSSSSQTRLPSKRHSNPLSSHTSTNTNVAPSTTTNPVPVRPPLIYRSRKRSSTISEETPTLTLSLIAARKRAQGNPTVRRGVAGDMGPPTSTSLRSSATMMRQMSED